MKGGTSPQCDSYRKMTGATLPEKVGDGLLIRAYRSSRFEFANTLFRFLYGFFKL
jgi:hypothetical protein